ncbi:MAG: SLBB domain-containing protein [Planctomycetota bacterium]
MLHFSAPVRRHRLLVACLMVLTVVGRVSAEEEAASNTYRLYPGDRIAVSVYGHDDLSTELRVPATGPVTFPLIGEIDAVAGLERDAFATRIRTALERDYLHHAAVTVTVREFAPRRVFVMGRVARPGVVELSPFVSLTANQAIGQAGGFRDDANREATVVLRADAEQPDKRQALPVPRIDPGGRGSAVLLQPGDLLLVPRLDRVYVLGAVARSGAVDLPSDEQLTVSKAISLAGGFTRFARQDAVQILRPGAESEAIDVGALLSGKQDARDPVLQPGDTVSVPESRF